MFTYFKKNICAVNNIYIKKKNGTLKKINGKLKIFRNEVTNHLDGQVGIYLRVYSTECVDEERYFPVEAQVPVNNHFMFSSHDTDNTNGVWPI
jgi:hypothetical protein